MQSIAQNPRQVVFVVIRKINAFSAVSSGSGKWTPSPGSSEYLHGHHRYRGAGRSRTKQYPAEQNKNIARIVNSKS
jgi:hypothetical protein